MSYTKQETIEFLGSSIPPNEPTRVKFDCAMVEQFAINDETFIMKEVPPDWNSGDITIVTGIIAMAAETGKTHRWQLQYRIHAVPPAVLSGIDATLDSGDNPLPTADKEIAMVMFTIPVADFKGKKHMHMKLTRLAAVDTNDPVTNPALMHSDIQYNARSDPI